MGWLLTLCMLFQLVGLVECVCLYLFLKTVCVPTLSSNQLLHVQRSTKNQLEEVRLDEAQKWCSCPSWCFENDVHS